MLSSLRSLSKSKVGTTLLVLFLVAIVASFAIADLGNVKSGSFGLGSSSLAKAGSETVTERDLTQLAERGLANLRQQKPDATYADLAAELPLAVNQLIDERAMTAFAKKHGLSLSRRLVDAEIAKIPGTHGLDGKFSETAYAQFLAQQRLTDAELRRLISAELIQRLILTPAAANARVPAGVATPYASLLLEQRTGSMTIVSTDAFRAGLAPTAGDLQAYYDQNKSRYMVPEQRVLRMASIGPEMVANVVPTNQEIAAYYNANKATYAGGETRVISQAVVADQKVAAAIAARARKGSFVAAAAPAGLSAEDISVGPQSRAQFNALAGAQVAAAAFSAQKGAIVGPIKSDLGWHVIRIDDIQVTGGKSIEAARSEIVAKLSDQKRKDALAEVVGKVEDAIADGSSLPEIAASTNLKLIETPLINAAGQVRNDPAYRLPGSLAAGLRSGFEIGADEDPVVETLPNDAGYVLVGVGRIVAAAPAPLADIRDKVTADWIQKKASDRARAVASDIAAKVAKGAPMNQVAAQAGKGVLPAQTLTARRIQISQAQGPAQATLKMLFSLTEGKSRMLAEPTGKGFVVVKVDKIVPGNALSAPSLITQTLAAFQQEASQELAQQVLSAIRDDVGIERNETAIRAAIARITGATN